MGLDLKCLSESRLVIFELLIVLPEGSNNIILLGLKHSLLLCIVIELQLEEFEFLGQDSVFFAQLTLLSLELQDLILAQVVNWAGLSIVHSTSARRHSRCKISTVLKQLVRSMQGHL